MDQNLIMSYEEQQKAEMEKRRLYEEQERRTGKEIFGRLGLASLIYTIIYTICIYKNVAGITMPVWVGSLVVYTVYILKLFQKEQKKDSIWIAGVMVLLGISTFLTGNEWIIMMNYMAVFLLLISLLLHNFADDRHWDMGIYFKEIVVSVFGAIGAVGKPFVDGGAFFKGKKKNSNGKGHYIVIGVCIAIPCLLFLTMLLMTADMVFANLLEQIFESFRFPARIFGVCFMLCFGFFSSYCGIRFIARHTGEIKENYTRQFEPVVAITVTGMIAVLYLLFSVIQIVYLFIGNMQLPDGITYADYARTGFFQLLFVCILNLALVIGVQKYFPKTKVLNVLLVVISACTFVMTASSACRMMLYISVYHLTFLRIFVLAALLIIALLMAGVTIGIFKADFPLFRYGMAVVSVVYLIFSFSHVDYFIASYNLAQIGGGLATDAAQEDYADYYYLASLSTDAAPAIEKYLETHDLLKKIDMQNPGWNWYSSYLMRNENEMEHITIRNFNLSHYIAGDLFGDYILQE